MEIIKNESNENGLKVVELVKDNKHLKMSLTKYDELAVSFSYDNDDKGIWFQEKFDVNKEDGEAYDVVNGTFLSYSGDVFFDTYGANLMLINDDGNYSFFFMQEVCDASHEIVCKFFDHSMENESMKMMCDKLQKIAKTNDKPKTLSKTLQNIVEK